MAFNRCNSLVSCKHPSRWQLSGKLLDDGCKSVQDALLPVLTDAVKSRSTIAVRGENRYLSAISHHRPWFPSGCSQAEVGLQSPVQPPGAQATVFPGRWGPIHGGAEARRR